LAFHPKKIAVILEESYGQAGLQAKPASSSVAGKIFNQKVPLIPLVQ
jgi:hypothetical protein